MCKRICIMKKKKKKKQVYVFLPKLRKSPMTLTGVGGAAAGAAYIAGRRSHFSPACGSPPCGVAGNFGVGGTGRSVTDAIVRIGVAAFSN